MFVLEFGIMGTGLGKGVNFSSSESIVLEKKGELFFCQMGSFREWVVEYLLVLLVYL